MRRTIATMTAVLGLALFSTACSSKPSGLHDPKVLAQAIATQMTMSAHSSDSYTDQLALAKQLDSGAPGDFSATCSKMDSGMFACSITDPSTGAPVSPGTINVEVSADGSSWEQVG